MIVYKYLWVANGGRRISLTLRIKKLRKDRSLTLKQMFELTNIPPSTLSEIENHRQLYKMEQLERIARALEVTVEDLFVK